MDTRIEQAQNEFLERVSRMGGAFGLNKFVIKMYVLLYLSDNPLSLDEIAQRLGVSKGNVSLNIRELERWGAVKNVWIKGSRKDFYQVEPDVKKVFFQKLKSALQKRISEVSKIIDDFNNNVLDANGELSEEERTVANGYLEKLKKINEIKTFASQSISLAEKFL